MIVEEDTNEMTEGKRRHCRHSLEMGSCPLWSSTNPSQNGGLQRKKREIARSAKESGKSEKTRQKSEEMLELASCAHKHECKERRMSLDRMISTPITRHKVTAQWNVIPSRTRLWRCEEMGSWSPLWSSTNPNQNGGLQRKRREISRSAKEVEWKS